MLRSILILLSLLLIHPSFSQSKAGMKKMMEEAQKAISDAEGMDPAMKQKLLKMMDGKSAAMENYAPPRFAQRPVSFDVPKRDNSRLSAIPATAPTDAQLLSSVQSMTSKMEKQLPETDIEDARAVISKAKGKSLYISTKAVGAWYNGYPEKALYLAAKAAALKDNRNALNNLSAMLNLYGYEEKAVPILLYLSQKQPGDVDVLNNLGRAYLGLGATDKAETIFLSCISIAPSHPEANASLGCLYESRGKKEKAEAHFEKSIEGAMNEIAIERLQSASPKKNIVTLMKKHYKAPEYFNQFKFQIPEELYHINDYYKIKKLHQAFRESISDLSKKYEALLRFSEKKMEEENKANYNHLLKAIETADMGKMNISISPFSGLAGRMQFQLVLYFEEVSHRFKDHYEKSIQELHEKYIAGNKQISDELDKQKKISETEDECGYCCLNCDEIERQKCIALERNGLAYQADAAGVHKDFADQYRLLLTGFFDDAAYWSALSGLSQHARDVQFYTLVNNFLSEIAYISKNTPFFIDPAYCNGDQAPGYDVTKQGYDTIKKPDCPISLKIPFIVGKLTLDCSSFSIAGGEGIKLGYKKSFKTGQSTLSIGAGITLETPGKLASASVNADESFYVTLDKDGNFMDVGVKFDAGAGIQSKGFNTKSGLGYTLGMNSGWGFTATSAGQAMKL